VVSDPFDKTMDGVPVRVATIVWSTYPGHETRVDIKLGRNLDGEMIVLTPDEADELADAIKRTAQEARDAS
jgi:phenylacetate-coenzyme A ligase PaaK-like adenylate-forming protein